MIEVLSLASVLLLKRAEADAPTGAPTEAPTEASYSFYTSYTGCPDISGHSAYETLLGLNLTFATVAECCEEFELMTTYKCPETLSTCYQREDVWTRDCTYSDGQCTGVLGEDIFSTHGECCESWSTIWGSGFGCGETECYIPNYPEGSCDHIVDDITQCSSTSNALTRPTIRDCLKDFLGYTYGDAPYGPEDPADGCWVPEPFAPSSDNPIAKQICRQHNDPIVCHRTDIFITKFDTQDRCCRSSFGYACPITETEFETDWNSVCYKRNNLGLCLEYRDIKACSRDPWHDVPIDIYDPFKTKEECCHKSGGCTRQAYDHCFVPTNNFFGSRVCKKSYNYEVCDVINTGSAWLGAMSYDECCHHETHWKQLFCPNDDVDPGAGPHTKPLKLCKPERCNDNQIYAIPCCESKDQYCDTQLIGADYPYGVCKNLVKCDHSSDVYIKGIPIYHGVDGSEYNLNGRWNADITVGYPKWQHQKHAKFYIMSSLSTTTGPDVGYTLYNQDGVTFLLHGKIPRQSIYYEIMHEGLTWEGAGGYTTCTPSECLYNHGFASHVDNTTNIEVKCAHYHNDDNEVLWFIE